MLDDVNSYVHHRILKKNKVTWSNCTAARNTLMDDPGPYNRLQFVRKKYSAT